MKSHHRILTAGLLGVALFAAACGSTNNTRTAAKVYGEIGSDGVTNLDANAVSTQTTTTLTAGASAPTTTAATAKGVTRTPKPSTGGNIEPPAFGQAPSAGFTGPGVTATEIKIGITLVQSGTIFGDVTGVPVDFGDTRAQANAVVEHMNKNGGIAGRKVVPVFYTFDLARPGLSDGQSEQEACSAWTEDSRVFAGINTALARQALLTCLAARGVPAIHNGMPIDEQTLNKYRNYWYAGYGGASLTLDRLAEKQVKVFAQQGLFGENAVVGIEYFDDPAYKRVVEEVFKPELAKAGVKKVVLQGAPHGGAEATSYVAAFRAAGVTHVLFMGEGALYPLFFMPRRRQSAVLPQVRAAYRHVAWAVAAARCTAEPTGQCQGVRLDSHRRCRQRPRSGSGERP